MTEFDPRYFVKFHFSCRQIEQYLKNALRDLDIAGENRRSEVKFNYSYAAFIKGGIVILAKVGKVKVRSIPGHHLKIIEKMGEILKDDSIESIGNTMRTKRNEDFYSGGIFVSEKESIDFYEFVKEI